MTVVFQRVESCKSFKLQYTKFLKVRDLLIGRPSLFFDDAYLTHIKMHC